METSQVSSLNDITKPANKPIGVLYAKDPLFLIVRQNFVCLFCQFSCFLLVLFAAFQHEVFLFKAGETKRSSI